MEAARGTALSRVDSIVDGYAGKAGALLGILKDVQALEPRRYLSEEALRRVSERTGTPLSAVYSVATFYSYFNLKPQGEHVVVVCRGTACHTRGSLVILEEAARILGIDDFREDEDSSFTTKDARFTLRTVACFGQCALAPVVSLDGQIHSRVNPARLAALLKDIKDAKGSGARPKKAAGPTSKAPTAKKAAPKAGGKKAAVKTAAKATKGGKK